MAGFALAIGLSGAMSGELRAAHAAADAGNGRVQAEAVAESTGSSPAQGGAVMQETINNKTSKGMSGKTADADVEAASANQQAQASQTALRQIYDKLKAGKKIVANASHSETKKPTVYLTFDDGPSKNTPKVLDILQKYHIHATFFEIGEVAKAYPDIVRRVVKEGHTLGNHSYNHVYDQLYSNFDGFWNQIAQTENVFDKIAGVQPRWIRAPGGTFENFGAFYYYYMTKAGYHIEDWNVEAGDAKRRGVPAAEMIENVKKSPLYHDVILLMHDGSGHAQTVKALPAIIAYYKKKGYAFAPLSESSDPLSYRISKLTSRWHRKTPAFQDFERTLSMIESQKPVWQHQTATDRKQGEGRPDSQSAASGSLKAQAASSAPLTIVWNGKRAELPSRATLLQGNQVHVAVRDLMKALGGRIQWDGTDRMVVAKLGAYTLQYRLKHNDLRILNMRRVIRTMPFPDMEISSGTMFVPLCKTLRMLNGSGVSLTRKQGQCQVKVSFLGPDILHLFRPLLFADAAPKQTANMKANSIENVRKEISHSGFALMKMAAQGV